MVLGFIEDGRVEEERKRTQGPKPAQSANGNERRQRKPGRSRNGNGLTG